MKIVDTKIYCDTCNENISPHQSLSPHDYILRVEVYDIARRDPSGFVHAMILYPPIDNDLYFCNLKCMKEYGNQPELKEALK